MWPQSRNRSSLLLQWWVAFRSYMGQMFFKTRDEMIHWMWDISSAFGDRIDRSNQQTTSLWKVERTSERFSWYSSDDLRAKIEPSSCWQHNQATSWPLDQWIGMWQSMRLMIRGTGRISWAQRPQVTLLWPKFGTGLNDAVRVVTPNTARPTGFRDGLEPICGSTLHFLQV